MTHPEIENLTNIFCRHLEKLEQRGISTQDVAKASLNIQAAAINPRAEDFIFENIDEEITTILSKQHKDTMQVSKQLGIPYEDCVAEFFTALKTHENPIAVNYHVRFMELLLDRN